MNAYKKKREHVQRIPFHSVPGNHARRNLLKKMKSVSEIEFASNALLVALDAYRAADKVAWFLPAVQNAARFFESLTHHSPRLSAVNAETDSRACGGEDGQACCGAFLMPDGSLRYWKASKELKWRGAEAFFTSCPGVFLEKREDIGGYDRVTVHCPGALFPVND